MSFLYCGVHYCCVCSYVSLLIIYTVNFNSGSLLGKPTEVSNEDDVFLGCSFICFVKMSVNLSVSFHYSEFTELVLSQNALASFVRPVN